MIVTTRAKPSAATIGLAWDGSRLWAGDYGARTVFVVAESGSEPSFAAPGRPLGMAFADGRLAVVLSHPETDNRTIRFFDATSQVWLEDVLRCPDDTGSQLAWDGGHLWLAQRYNKVVLQLHPDGTVKHTIEVQHEVTGFAWLGASVWLNLRVEKGVSEIAKRGPGANRATPVERVEGSLVSLAHDGERFWTVDTHGNALYGIRPD